MLEMRTAFLGLPVPRLRGTDVAGVVTIAGASTFLSRPNCLYRGPEVGLNFRALLASRRNRSRAQSVLRVNAMTSDCEHSCGLHVTCNTYFYSFTECSEAP
jgi:hypothetical protein